MVNLLKVYRILLQMEDYHQSILRQEDMNKRLDSAERVRLIEEMKSDLVKVRPEQPAFTHKLSPLRHVRRLAVYLRGLKKDILMSKVCLWLFLGWPRNDLLDGVLRPTTTLVMQPQLEQHPSFSLTAS